MDRARSVQLVSGSTRGLEAELVQYLFHRDFSTQHVEVNPGIISSLCPGDLVFWYREKRHRYSVFSGFVFSNSIDSPNGSRVGRRLYWAYRVWASKASGVR